MKHHTAQEVATSPEAFAEQLDDMRSRQAANIADMQNNSPVRIGDATGVLSINGAMQIIGTKGATFESHRDIFDDGTRVVRSGQLGFTPMEGSYQLSTFAEIIDDGTLMQLLKSDKAPVTTAQEGEKHINGSYAIFQTAPIEHPEHTRGGFLGLMNQFGAQPLITHVNGTPYVIEVKGVGNAAGGFECYTDQFFKRVTKGGLSISDAHREIQNLEAAHAAGLTPILPLALGKLMLTEAAKIKYGDLAVVFRLTPTTLRLSHRETPASVPLESTADTMVVMDKLVTNFLDKFTRTDDSPVFISPASHLENYLVDDGLEISETDFEDFRTFGSNDLPYVHTQTAQFMDTECVVRGYFANMSGLPGFDKTEHVELLTTLVDRKLIERSIPVDLSGCTSAEQVATRLWGNWLVNLDYQARKDNDYVPVAMRDFVESNHQRVVELTEKLSTEYRHKEFEDPELQQLQSQLVDSLELLDATAVSGHYKNKDRTHAFRSVLVRHDSTRDQLTEYASKGETPDSIRKLANAFSIRYEVYNRVMNGLNFFARYISSERIYLEQLDEKHHEETTMLRQKFTTVEKLVSTALDSTDPALAVVFFHEFMVDFMEDLYIESADTYAGRQ